MSNRTSDHLEAALNGEPARNANELSELVTVARALRRLPQDGPAERNSAALAQLRGALRDARQKQEQRGWRWSWGVARLGAAAAAVAVIIAAIVMGTAGRGGVSQALQGLLPNDTNTKIVGVISDVTNDRLVVQVGGKTVVVAIEERTLVTDANKEGMEVSQLSAGQTVEIKGDEQDGVITAVRVKITDGTQPEAGQ
jgi:hypothetical protein